MSPYAGGRLLVACLVLAAPGVRAEVPLTERIDRENQKLGEVQDRFTTVQRKIRSLTSRREDLDRRLAESRREQGELEHQIARLKAEASRAVGEVEAAHAALLEARRAHAEYEASYAQRLVHIYKRTALSPVGALLESQSLGELVRRNRYLQLLKEDAGHLKVLEESRDRVSLRTAALEAARARADTLRGELEERERNLSRNILEQSRLLDQIRRERDHEIQKASKLQDAQELLKKKIENLQRAATVMQAERRAPRPPARRQIQKGQLRWPIDGDITILKPFGRTVNEVGTPEFNQGHEILITQPTSVKAVADGQVIFQGIFSPVYGKVVMVAHGGSPVDVISLYGNLDTILVGVDQEVREGDIIGTVGGDSSSGRTSHLRIEIRKGTDAQNPSHWLARR